jgi:hypothetical protein
VFVAGFNGLEFARHKGPLPKSDVGVRGSSGESFYTVPVSGVLGKKKEGEFMSFFKQKIKF